MASTAAVYAKADIGHKRLPDCGLLIGCHPIECLRRITTDAQHLRCALAEQALRAERGGFLLEPAFLLIELLNFTQQPLWWNSHTLEPLVTDEALSLFDGRQTLLGASFRSAGEFRPDG